MEKTSQQSVIALIPARSGSKRVKSKNIRMLAGHPLIAYTIAAAKESNVFDAIVVSTDSEKIADIADHYGAEVPFLRPGELAGDVSPDIEWVEYTLKRLKESGRVYDCFSILRPTSPFRRGETVSRAWALFAGEDGVDSLRAVERCRQHPGKMWVVGRNRMFPLLPFCNSGAPWHSSQYQSLPEIYVQNASLEIAWCHVVFNKHSIGGDTFMPFFTENYEGFDINDLYDWKLAEEIVNEGSAALPVVDESPFREV
jgi:CMP-N,N'-diacetyllegionaminic acid synthase